MKSSEPYPWGGGSRPRPGRLWRQELTGARPICFPLLFVCAGVCFSHCLCLCAFFPLMALSSVSPTLAIFCLVASNVLLCLSAVTKELIYVHLQIQELTVENYIYFKRAKKKELSFYPHVEEKRESLRVYLSCIFTDAMSFIRYEVKSASRNMTNAFGNITSVLWIQSLRQLTANDTGGNFSRQQWWAILPSAWATNWQIGTKSRVGDKCVTKLLLLAKVCICVASK